MKIIRNYSLSWAGYFLHFFDLTKRIFLVIGASAISNLDFETQSRRHCGYKNFVPHCPEALRYAKVWGGGCCTQPYPCICKEAVSGFEPMTNKSPRHNFTAAPGLALIVAMLSLNCSSRVQRYMKSRVNIISWNFLTSELCTWNGFFYIGKREFVMFEN